MTNQVAPIYDPTINAELGFVSAYKQLRPIEKMFVDAYLADLENSARNAGKRVVDYLQSREIKAHGAQWYADKFMKVPMVRAAITERVNELTAMMEISAYKVLKETANIAMSSMGHYFEFLPDGDIQAKLHECTPEQLAAIQSIEVEEVASTGRKKIKLKLHPKLQAIDMLMRYMGLYEADNGQKAPVVGMPGSQQPQITQEVSTAKAAEMYAETLRKVV